MVYRFPRLIVLAGCRGRGIAALDGAELGLDLHQVELKPQG